jgi:3-methyladenine DNA glycosylase/8-oxoguanine DNA glycosylase
MEIQIRTPREFDFERTLGSHGWSDLAPFGWISSREVTRVIDLDREPVTVTVRGRAQRMTIDVPRRLAKLESERVERDIRHMFRLDDNMSEFYRAMGEHPEFEWISSNGAGRLLRSPTVYEDLVKSIMTTNCSWSLTRKMVNGLVDSIGRESRGGGRAFPTAEAMTTQPLAFYTEQVRAGYRAPYFKELADRVASGELDVESWANTDMPTEQLKREMKTVKGVGDYAAENLLKLVGRYDVLALDSWVRSKFAKVRNNGRTAPDKKIAKYYSRFGEWRGLALWCDMTKDWF